MDSKKETPVDRAITPGQQKRIYNQEYSNNLEFLQGETVTFCSGNGQYHSENHKTKPQSYLQIGFTEILKMASNPPNVEKAQARWAIFSNLPSRIHAEQRKRGVFFGGWIDIDENPRELKFVIESIRDLFPETNFIAYTTKSATPGNQKCRVIIPFPAGCPGNDYVLVQKILNDRLENANITPDRKTELRW